MKTKLIAAGLLLLTTVAAVNATPLIDLDPEGRAAGFPYPGLLDYIQLVTGGTGGGLLDSIDSVTGWVGRFGMIQGADYIQANLTQNQPVTRIAWDFSGSTFRVIYVDVFGQDADGIGWEHFYKARHFAQNGSSEGFLPVTVDGSSTIRSIAFWGSDGRVSDSGSSALLLAGALAVMALLQSARMVSSR